MVVLPFLYYSRYAPETQESFDLMKTRFVARRVWMETIYETRRNYVKPALTAEPRSVTKLELGTRLIMFFWGSCSATCCRTRAMLKLFIARAAVAGTTWAPPLESASEGVGELAVCGGNAKPSGSPPMTASPMPPLTSRSESSLHQDRPRLVPRLCFLFQLVLRAPSIRSSLSSVFSVVILILVLYLS